MDLAALWKRRRWVHLLALIDQLPSNSRYYEEYLNDPEIARRVADEQERQREERDEDAPEWTPPQRTWSPEMELLATNYDQLQAIQATQIGVGGGKPRKPKSYPRPKSLVDTYRQQIREEKQDDIINLFKAPS